MANETVPVLDPSRVRSILATDCGSTTTKAILIEKQADGVFRLITRGEAPTTVEAPFDDVTVGVTNAVREVEELSGKMILAGPDVPRSYAVLEDLGLPHVSAVYWWIALVLSWGVGLAISARRYR